MSNIKAIVLKKQLYVALILALAVTGFVILLLVNDGRASTPVSSIETESGSLDGVTSIVDSSASGGHTIKFGTGSDDCTPNAILVNPCRALLGEAAGNYPEVASDKKSQFLYAEQRVGHNFDLIHTYHPPGSNHLKSVEQYFYNQPGTTLFVNWKPASTWAEAASSSNYPAIDSMASDIKALGNKKIFMTLWHEPENDVTPGGDPNCPDTDFSGSAGTVADYKAMWQNVEDRFAADGVTNVVWALDYMNYPKWNCVVPDLYPGNDLVDWVVFNGYGAAYVTNDTFQNEVGPFYSMLTNLSTTSRDYLSKPWGIVEWGIDGSAASGVSEAEQIAYYNSAKQSVIDNTYPKLKMYMAFDEGDQGQLGGSDLRVGYNGGNADQNTQDAYNAFYDAVLAQSP